jgi:hypothetical protein
MAARFGAEFFGVISLTPASGRLLPVLTASAAFTGDGTVMGFDVTGGGGGGGGGDAGTVTLMKG